MAHPSFSATRSLPSLRVSKTLLQDVETFLFSKAAELGLGHDPQNAARVPLLKIKLQDSLGTEEISTSSDFSRMRFIDSTEQVALTFRTPSNLVAGGSRAEITFARGRMSSEATVETTLPDAREKTLGILDALLRVFDEYRTDHWAMNPTPTVLFLHLALIGAALVLAGRASLGEVGNLALTVFVLLSVAYIILGNMMRPYIYFDSRAADRIDSRWKWAVGGFGTFVVFSTIAVYFRRELLGF